MEIQIESIKQDTQDFVVSYISDNWGSAMIVTRGNIYNIEKLPGFVAVIGDKVKGIITYNIQDKQCEIVSLDSLYENKGIGTFLIQEVISLARGKGCIRVWLVTTNDNIHAIRYYQKRGFDLVKIHRNAVNESRKIKPEIPVFGFDGIPILHEIEFEKIL